MQADLLGLTGPQGFEAGCVVNTTGLLGMSLLSGLRWQARCMRFATAAAGSFWFTYTRARRVAVESLQIEARTF